METAPIYLYDGSLAGLYCCVHESVYARQLPMEIEQEGAGQPSLFERRYIPTDLERAKRVREAVYRKISPRARELVETVYFSCLPGRELKMLRYLLLGFQAGRRIDDMISHPDVNVLLKAEKHLWGEQHLLLGFVRFADYGGLLAATITPKNFVLPFLADHFCDRYSQERFVIYDAAHGAALLYSGGQRKLVQVEDIQFQAPDERELQYRALWKRFYETIAIQERTNHRCRMTHMPKRYWPNMFEMEGQH